jgi:hypothetical protein
MDRRDILSFRISAATRCAVTKRLGADGSAWRAQMVADRSLQPLPLPPERYGPFLRDRTVRLHSALFPAALVALGRLESAASVSEARRPRDGFEPLLNALVDADVRARGGRGALRAGGKRAPVREREPA